LVKKKAKPNFRTLGKKLGKHMKDAAERIQNFDADQIQTIEKGGSISLQLDGEQYSILKEDLEIISEDIPGWLVSHDGDLTVALDIHLTPELLAEGHARELINRIQNLRRINNSMSRTASRSLWKKSRNFGCTGALPVPDLQ